MSHGMDEQLTLSTVALHRKAEQNFLLSLSLFFFLFIFNLALRRMDVSGLEVESELPLLSAPQPRQHRI